MYKSLDAFLFRTPYFPYSALPDFEKKLHEPIFREMLQIATPDLSKDMDKGTDKVQYSTRLYYQRACTRPTPFGLFAGCSMGFVGEYTKILLSEQKEYRRNTRLDMNYICALTQQIERDRSIREHLHYYSNRSMYPIGNQLRYVEYYYRKTQRVYQITQIGNSNYLQMILSLARNGARFTELATALLDDEITMEEAVEFIHELIDAQVLVSELEPTVTNVQPLTTIILKLKGLPNVNRQIINVLFDIETQLANIDRKPIGTTDDVYPAIVKNIEKTRVDAEIKYLFQTDMFKPVQHATVSHNLIKDIQQAIVFFNKITFPVQRINLSQFRENFVKRYDNREMPLLFVLDNEIGIGYAENTSGDISPLVDDLVIPHENSPSNVLQSSIQLITLQRFKQSSQEVIELTDEDVKDIEVTWDDLPETISVMCQILQDNDKGRSIYIKVAGGQSAAILLGRFCHLDEQILNFTLAITEKEAQLHPDVIFAEIVHLPESRIGNVLLRPVLRPHEIPYLAKPGVSDEFELRLDDLYVSVKSNRIILRSKRLNREIIPRMSTAHNYKGQNSMPVYQFLCEIQHQNERSGLGFFWNEMIQQMDYLPRVVYKNCILSRARWTVREKEVKDFSVIKDDNEFLQKIKEWQIKRNIPNRVLWADGDNELYIDLNNPFSIRAWLSVIKKRQFFYLEEFLFNPETAVVHGPEGVFTNEFIFAFYRESTARKAQ
jgi:hypothetical protein